MGLFRSEPNPIETLVREATAETLTSEDWSKIIAVCDTINAKPGKNGPLAVEALRQRLQVANGNVQLYSLTLLNALAQNCGPVLQREIASTQTTQVLQRLGQNPGTHRVVLSRLLDVLGSMAEDFAGDISLNQIQQVYDRLCKAHPGLAAAKRHSSPGSHSQPPEPAVIVEDEDEDLKRAIELSIRESQQQLTPDTEISRAAATVAEDTPRHYVRGLYDFAASEPGELSFAEGDIIEVMERVYKEWWKGLLNGEEGIFPVNYVEEYIPEVATNKTGVSTLSTGTQGGFGGAAPAPAPAADASALGESAGVPVIDESYLFAQVPAVEKLLTILAAANQDGTGSSVISNPEIQRLYHQVTAMRPRLVQIIDEYAAKKDELVHINQLLLLARRNYERLVSEAASGHHRQPMPPAAYTPATQPAQTTPASLTSAQSIASHSPGIAPASIASAPPVQVPQHTASSQFTASSQHTTLHFAQQQPLQHPLAQQRPLSQPPVSQPFLVQSSLPQATAAQSSHLATQSPHLTAQSPHLTAQSPHLTAQSLAQPAYGLQYAAQPQQQAYPYQQPQQLPYPEDQAYVSQGAPRPY